MENLVAEATRFFFAQTLSVLESPAPLTPEYFDRPRRKAYLLWMLIGALGAPLKGS